MPGLPHDVEALAPFRAACVAKPARSECHAIFTQSGPFASGSSLLAYQTSSVATVLATRTQTCTVLIDLSNLPQLPAGSSSVLSTGMTG